MIATDAVWLLAPDPRFLSEEGFEDHPGDFEDNLEEDEEDDEIDDETHNDKGSIKEL